MIEIIKRFTCDFCEWTSEIEMGSDSLYIHTSAANFNIIRNDDGDFCNSICYNLYLEAKS